MLLLFILLHQYRQQHKALRTMVDKGREAAVADMANTAAMGTSAMVEFLQESAYCVNAALKYTWVWERVVWLVG